LPYGVAELERFAASKETIQLQHPGMPDLVKLMNIKADYGTAIHAMYWKVDPRVSMECWTRSAPRLSPW
jgi:hypothetical protein